MINENGEHESSQPRSRRRPSGQDVDQDNISQSGRPAQDTGVRADQQGNTAHPDAARFSGAGQSTPQQPGQQSAQRTGQQSTQRTSQQSAQRMGQQSAQRTGQQSTQRTRQQSSQRTVQQGIRQESAARQIAPGSISQSRSRASASKGQAVDEKKLKKRKTIRRLIVFAVAECFALVAIFGYAYFARRLNLISRPDVDKNVVKNEDLQVEDLVKMEGYWMIAVFGVDSRNGSTGAGNQSDVNMIACVNQDTGEIKLVSLYRDTYLNTGDGRYSKFNEAYAKGGPEQALKYLNKNLDLNITDYITFSWKAVADGINILGGVDINITNSEFKYINSFITETVNSTGVGSHQLTSAGMNHLDGVQAVAYGRLRLMDNDYKRTERQREVIAQVFEKAKAADYSVLNNILVVVLPEVSTNLEFADLTQVALNTTKYYLSETTGFPFTCGDANMGSKGACVIPQTLSSNVSQLHAFLFDDEDYDPTQTVKDISARIASDTGMYSQGKSISSSSSSTGTSSKSSSDDDEDDDEDDDDVIKYETDEYGNIILSPNGSTIAVVPGIGETDEYGNLVDGPEDDDYYDGYSGYIYPGMNTSNTTGSSSTSSTTATREPQYPGDTGDEEEEGPGSNYTETVSQESDDKPTVATEAVGPGVTSTTETTATYPGSTTETSPVSSENVSPVSDTTAAVSPDSNYLEVEAGPGYQSD